MSGGSYDYFCYKIDDIELKRNTTDNRRIAFQKLLSLVSKAMHDIEWVDSGDYGEGDDHEAIDACWAFTGADPKIVAKAMAYDKLVEYMKHNEECNK
ncbi:MAG: hypothetical protein KAQ85_02275 [Thermodesulfovibrionia bacterium]|nr:hypothetical protein [Thermodesulfovibrionia bacterium]